MQRATDTDETSEQADPGRLAARAVLAPRRLRIRRLPASRAGLVRKSNSKTRALKSAAAPARFAYWLQGNRERRKKRAAVRPPTTLTTSESIFVAKARNYRHQKGGNRQDKDKDNVIQELGIRRRQVGHQRWHSENQTPFQQHGTTPPISFALRRAISALPFPFAIPTHTVWFMIAGSQPETDARQTHRDDRQRARPGPLQWPRVGGRERHRARPCALLPGAKRATLASELRAAGAGPGFLYLFHQGLRATYIVSPPRLIRSNTLSDFPIFVAMRV
jgi:hypothetical protein